MTAPELYFEDFAPGRVFRCGSYAFTEAEIIRFASKFDPQPFHTDPEAAKQGLFGRLCASGWQVAGVQMRLLVQGVLARTAAMGSPGMKQVRWMKPVFPGDVLTLTVTTLAVAPWGSKGDRGLVTNQSELHDAAGVLKFRAEGMVIVRRRP